MEEEKWYQRLGDWVYRHWRRLTYPIMVRIYGDYPKVDWERGGMMYLYDFDASLAAIIRDGIAVFRKHNIGVLYVEGGPYQEYGINENVIDKTEWLFDELIWTFDTLAKGGVRCLPDVEALLHEAYGGSKSIFTPRGDGTSTWSITGVKEDAKKEMRRLEEEYQERIDRGLRLFIEHLPRMWI